MNLNLHKCMLIYRVDTNKIKESNLMYDNDTISSSKNLTTVYIDNSIIKLAN